MGTPEFVRCEQFFYDFPASQDRHQCERGMGHVGECGFVCPAGPMTTSVERPDSVGVNAFLKMASPDDVRGLNAYMNRDLVRKKALAWVEKQPGQDAPSIHILNLLDIVSGLETQNFVGVRRNGGDPADVEVRVWVGQEFAVVRVVGHGNGEWHCEILRYESPNGL